ncbi:MAG: ATP-binding protein [Bacteroidales bacterium]|nr:MAG: ATP-binding protein [Bacteroidales bacterium]
MTNIDRILLQQISKKIQSGKAIVLLGARRTGKTFLINEILKQCNEPYILLNGEDFRTSEILKNKGIIEYRQLIGNNKLLAIDEAQKVQNIGSILKIMIDEIEGLKIIATGSSAFDLSNQTGEPLTGRKYTYYLYPLAQCELTKYENTIETNSNLEQRLIYGSYPEVFRLNDNDDKIQYLLELVNSYLLKDILVLDKIKNADKLFNILKLLAFQIGHEVSLNEIAKQVGLNKITVERYLDLLEKVFVIKRITAYSKNLRKEISKNCKYYFWDLGIRNTLISNLHSLNLRNDIGQLWENYIITERLKKQSYKMIISNNYFWRTYNQQEIDWIEEREGKLFAYEIKLTSNKFKIPSAWKDNYVNSEYQLINKDNYLEFIV